jgi:hypothetical protein
MISTSKLNTVSHSVSVGTVTKIGSYHQGVVQGLAAISKMLGMLLGLPGSVASSMTLGLSTTLLMLEALGF